MLSALSSLAQTSIYQIDPFNIDYSGLGTNGGTIIAPMVLVDGPAVPDIGTTFNITA